MKSMVSEDSTSNGRDGSWSWWSCFRETEDEMAGYSDYAVDAVGRFDFERGCVSCEIETRWRVVVMFP